jgi:hypothetical protein
MQVDMLAAERIFFFHLNSTSPPAPWKEVQLSNEDSDWTKSAQTVSHSFAKADATRWKSE